MLVGRPVSTLPCWQMGSLEMTSKQYNGKLNDIALLRRTFAGVIEAQAHVSTHHAAMTCLDI